MTITDSSEILFKNGTVFNSYTGEWLQEDIIVREGRIRRVGTDLSGKNEVDLKGRYVLPGFIDAHVHIESSLISPYEYSRLVIGHGTTTVIADPHEIANVCGTAGIEYMLRAGRSVPLDILLMLPSCVPATPMDECAMPLSPDELAPFIRENGVIGIGEMMNVPGVLSQDPEVMDKLALMPIRDGHAPSLRGEDLDEYIFAGLQSDHESTRLDEAREKLQKGMYLFIREGSTERNLKTLIPLVSAFTAARCCFCTDDRHLDMLAKSGHIDDCIRKAIEYGCEPEYAYRMATLTPAERFGLIDRGAVSPGKIADLLILTDMKKCQVARTYKAGRLISPGQFSPQKSPHVSYIFRPELPLVDQISIRGKGTARIVGLQEGQIGTTVEYHDISGDQIPDLKHDILKLVVVSRYHPGQVGVGLVTGFKIQKGAIASSVSHDSHNIIATGTSDQEILAALGEVIRGRGGMVAFSGRRRKCLSLPLAGLMSDLSFEEASDIMAGLTRLTDEMGSVENPFMYLSFLALTVIPEIRVTEQGVFDFSAFSPVPLFL